MSRPTLARTAAYVGQSVVSGTLGWVALMLAFEGAWWVHCYLVKLRRK